MLSWLKYITNYLGILENAELVEILSLTLGFMVDFSVVVGVSKPATTGGGHNIVQFKIEGISKNLCAFNGFRQNGHGNNQGLTVDSG